MRKHWFAVHVLNRCWRYRASLKVDTNTQKNEQIQEATKSIEQIANSYNQIVCFLITKWINELIELFFFRVNRNTQSMTTSWVGEKHKNNVIDGNLILTEAETTSDDICSIPFVNRFILPSILLIFWILSHWIQTVTKSKNKNQKMHFVKLSSAVDRWALMNRIL